MATPSEWYTSLQRGGAPVSAPLDRRAGGRGGKFDSFLSKQRNLRHAMAKEELKQMQLRSRQMSLPRSLRRTEHPQGPARGRQEWKDASRAGMEAKALLGMNKARMTESPFANQNMGTWLNAIGPARAHAGMMQVGRLMGSNASSDPGPLPEYLDPTGMSGGPGVGAGHSLPKREKGTVPGTVSKTEPALIHKGEIVISADQVDRPLLAALKADRLMKMYSGQMDGKGTGPGPPTAKSMVKDEFRGGTLHGYQGGTLEELMAGYQLPPDPANETGAGVTGWGPLTPKAVRALRRLFGGGAGEKTEKPSPGSDLGEPPPGFSDEEISQKLIAGGAEGREEESGFFDLPGFEPWKGLPSGAREWGERARESLPDFGGMVEDAGGFLGGFTGAPETPPAPEAVEPEGLGETAEEAPGVEALLALSPEQEQQGRDRQGGIANEATFARAAAGDRGLGEAGPLTLQRSGPTQRTSYEPGDRADPAVREREKREFNATMNQMKADRLHDYLMEKGGDLDPQTFKAVQDQAKQLQAINKSEKDRQMLIDESAKDRLTEMDKATKIYEGHIARAEATGEASVNVGLRQAKQHLREKFSRYELEYWEKADAGMSRRVLEQMALSLIEMEAALEGHKPGDEGYQEWYDANMEYRLGVIEG